MGVSPRQARRLLARRNVEVEGRLLRSIGNKTMPGGRVQSSKWLVSMAVFRESMRPDDGADRDIEKLRLEVLLIGQQLAAMRRAMRPILAYFAGSNGTERDAINT
jgi:hypothetical protein